MCYEDLGVKWEILVLCIRKMSEIQKRGPQTGERLKREEAEVYRWCQGRGGSGE